MEIDLDNVEEVDVTKKQKKKEKKIFKTDILDDDEKKEKGTQVLRNVEKIHKSKHTIWILKS
jgi:hypothetical protein